MCQNSQSHSHPCRLLPIAPRTAAALPLCTATKISPTGLINFCPFVHVRMYVCTVVLQNCCCGYGSTDGLPLSFDLTLAPHFGTSKQLMLSLTSTVMSFAYHAQVRSKVRGELVVLQVATRYIARSVKIKSNVLGTSSCLHH